jgi:hypothetical protein
VIVLFLLYLKDTLIDLAEDNLKVPASMYWVDAGFVYLFYLLTNATARDFQDFDIPKSSADVVITFFLKHVKISDNLIINIPYIV